MFVCESAYGCDGAYVVATSGDVLARAPESPLSPEENDRCLALGRRADRMDFRAARILVRLLLATVAETAISDIRIWQSCDRCGGPHGRPVVEDPRGYEVSWAHHDGLVAAAVARRAIGIDIISRRVTQGSPTGVLDEKGLCRFEALFKAGAYSASPPLRFDDLQRDDCVYLDRANRRLRILVHSTPLMEVCVASSCILRSLHLVSLISALA